MPILEVENLSISFQTVYSRTKTKKSSGYLKFKYLS